jgi:hypothetical protein
LQIAVSQKYTIINETLFFYTTGGLYSQEQDRTEKRGLAALFSLLWEYVIQERLGVLAATRTVRKHLPLCASASPLSLRSALNERPPDVQRPPEATTQSGIVTRY